MTFANLAAHIEPQINTDETQIKRRTGSIRLDKSVEICVASVAKFRQMVS